VQVSNFMEVFVGVIADGAIISIGTAWNRGESKEATHAILDSLGCWGRLVISRFLLGFAILGGLLMFFFPGVYFGVRLMFLEPVIVAENLSPIRSCRRSAELTRERFWPLLAIFALYLSISLVTLEFVVYMTECVTSFDHWWLSTAQFIIADFARAYGILCLTFAYARISGIEKENPEASIPHQKVRTIFDD